MNGMRIHFGESGPLDETLRQYRVPDHIHEGLIAYIVEGRVPGSFLAAVLSNDLKNAVAFADDENRCALPQIIRWLYNEAPNPCWGSPEKFGAWLLKKHEDRYGKAQPSSESPVTREDRF